MDRVLEVVDEYQVKINKLERDILLHPVMDSVRSRTCSCFSSCFFSGPHHEFQVHILSGDLIMHKRTLEPIRTMVYGLRRYDLERCHAVADSVALERQRYCDTESESATSPTTRKMKVDPVLVSRTKRRRQRKRHLVKESRIQPLHLLDEDDHGYYCEVDGHQQQSRRVEGFFSYKSKVYLVGRF